MAWSEGRVFAIELEDGRQGFGRCLVSPVADFYDVQSTSLDDVDLDELVHSRVAFTLCVEHRAVRSWRKLGVVPLTDAERGKEHVWFRQDLASGDLVRYFTDTEGREHEEPISFQETAGLEAAAVWGDVHVKSRLTDHFAGRPNKFWQSLRPKET